MNMNPIEKVCNLQCIEDYLDERLSDSAVVEFEYHLIGCEHCRTELQKRSAEPEIWRDAIALLSSIDSFSHDQNSGEQSNGQGDQHVSNVLELLAPTDDPEMLGRIGGYEIIGVVGFGGMGAVLKGFDKSLCRVVAIKMMAPHLAGSGSARRRFQREAKAAAAITHENVIDIYGVSEENGLPYLVMPFARGPSLQKRINESGPLTTHEVVRIGLQIASGLAAAHEQGLVHRDIKPANILLNEGNERLWITDFGIARAVDDASMTQTGVIAGTPQYMSPEQARGESVDQRSDLFSMGSVLYTACTGRPPFRSESAYGVLRRITDTAPRRIIEINPDIPIWLCRLIERLMEKHPTDRFKGASEVVKVLEGCMAHLQQPTIVELPQCVASSSRSGESVSPKDKKWPKQSRSKSTHSSYWRRTRNWILICLAILAGSGIAAMQMTKPEDISGRWSGEKWKSVSLTTVEKASGWYTGTFTNLDGRQGALQLEWSRLQRRYNGRWMIGDDLSGSVTLRVSANELRGAVAVDSYSRVAAKMPRLREFIWVRSPDAVKRFHTDKFKGPPTAIQSPVIGHIVRWGEGIRENSHVNKGDLLAEVANLDSEYLDRLKKQLADSAVQVEAAKKTLASDRRQLEAMRSIVAALKSQQSVYEKVANEFSKASRIVVDSAKIKVETTKAERDEVFAELEQARAEFDQQKMLFDKRLVSQLKFKQAERKLKQAEAKVKNAETQIQSSKNELNMKLNDRASKQAKAKADLAQVAAQLNKALADIARLESDIAKAESHVAKSQSVYEELQTKLSRQAKIIVRAPFTGFVTDVIDARGVLKKGGLLCYLWPEVAENVPENSSVEKKHSNEEADADD